MRKVGSKVLRKGYTISFFFTSAGSAKHMCQEGPGIAAEKEFGLHSLTRTPRSSALCGHSPRDRRRLSGTDLQ